MKNHSIREEMTPVSNKSSIQSKEEKELSFKLENVDSPYKNLKQTDTQIILNDSASDEADFRSPVPIRKPNNSKVKLGKTASQKSQTKSKTSTNKGRPKKYRSKKNVSQNYTIKIINDNFKCSEENPEHLQMALALSKSTYEAERSSSCQSPPKEETPNISEILRNSRNTFLERFGFTSNPKMNVESRKMATVSSEANKRNKNRFKYITPILNIRTNEERISLITSKISLIVCQNNLEHNTPSKFDINSNKLNDLIAKERNIFNLDEVYEKNNFYVECLEIPHSMHKCGYLLKDWNLIPGRDRSPCKKVESVSLTVDKDYVLSPISCAKATEYPEETTVTTVLSKNTLETKTTIKENSPYTKSPVKNQIEMLGVRTKIQETIFESFNSESKDSAITTSVSNSISSTFPSFTSSYRSVSPDLFGSDSETNDDPVLDGTVSKNLDGTLSKNLFSFEKSSETQRSDSLFENAPEKIDDNLEPQQKKNVLKDEVKSELPIEIIDLTDDDYIEEVIGKSPKKKSSVDNGNFSNYCVSSQLINDTEQETLGRQENIYDLDEFQEDNSNTLQLSPNNKHNDYFHNSGSGDKFDNQSPGSPRSKQYNNSHFSDYTTDVSKNVVTSQNNTSFTHIQDTNENASDVSFEKLETNMFSHDGRNIVATAKTCITNETKDYQLDDRGDQHVIENNFCEELEKEHTSIDDITKRNHDCHSHNIFNDTSEEGKGKAIADVCTVVFNKSNNYRLNNSKDSHDLQRDLFEELEEQKSSIDDTPERNRECNSHTIFSNINEQRKRTTKTNDYQLGNFKDPHEKQSSRDDIAKRDLDEQRKENIADDIGTSTTNFINNYKFNGIEDPHNSENGVFGELEKQLSGINDTPKRNSNYNSHTICGDAAKQRKKPGNIKVISPCFDEPHFDDSVNFNVTDYVNNMLNQEQLSFDKSTSINDGNLENEGNNIGSDEEISVTQSSQGSMLLDEELNYSSHFGTPLRVNDKAGGKEIYISDEEIENMESRRPQTLEIQEDDSLELALSQNFPNDIYDIVSKESTNKSNSTPDNFIIKTKNVTPLPEYDTMETPIINKELEKFGVKPLKRTRDPREHSVSDNPDSDEDKRVIKRRKKDNECPSKAFNLTNSLIPFDSKCGSSTKIIGNKIIEKRNGQSYLHFLVHYVPMLLEEAPIAQRQIMYFMHDGAPTRFPLAVRNHLNQVFERRWIGRGCPQAWPARSPDLNPLHFYFENPEDLIFERKQSVRIPSCKVPLQIVWHNLVGSHPEIKENILLYEPLQLETLHLMLKEQGFKFNIQDLLTFLDKKCITIRTAQKSGKMQS